MPFYYAIRNEPEDVRKRTAQGLLRLRERLKEEVPLRTLSDTLLLATWNVREFDSPKYGARTSEPLHYIAEIISHFDLVALQEVREDLSALDTVQEMLGGWWKYIVTDVTYGASGNGERMAFMYDSRTVTFGGLAGEVVLPDVRGEERALQFARTPFLCGFKASWTKFNLCTVHVYYGKAKPDDPRRIAEIERLAELLADKARPSGKDQPARPDGKVTAVRNKSPENLILLGDFNIFARGDRTFEGLTKAGFVIPDELLRLPGSNVDKSKYYDQIAFFVRPERFGTTHKAGVFDFFASVFRLDEEATYESAMGPGYAKAKKKTAWYKQWRTFQMSDHLLMWVELKIDFGTEYLTKIAEGPAD
jgi:endonuclease/exonuclease/phosphatase family metal-dependent hydrolase